MASFFDSEGERWSIDLSFGLIARVRKLLGVALADLTAEDRKVNQAATDIARVAGDPALFVDLLYVLCEEQATAAGVTDQQFGQRVNLHAYTESAAALQEAIMVFTLPREQKSRGIELIRKRHQLIDQQMAARVRKAMNGLEEFGNSDASSVELSESISGNSVSGN